MTVSDRALAPGNNTVGKNTEQLKIWGWTSNRGIIFAKVHNHYLLFLLERVRTTITRPDYHRKVISDPGHTDWPWYWDENKKAGKKVMVDREQTVSQDGVWPLQWLSPRAWQRPSRLTHKHSAELTFQLKPLQKPENQMPFNSSHLLL